MQPTLHLCWLECNTEDISFLEAAVASYQKSLKNERPMNIIVLLMCTKTPFIASTDPNHNTSSLIEPASLNLMKEVVYSPTTDEDPGTLFAEDGVAEKPAKPGALDQRESKCRIIPSRT